MRKKITYGLIMLELITMIMLGIIFFNIPIIPISWFVLLEIISVLILLITWSMRKKEKIQTPVAVVNIAGIVLVSVICIYMVRTEQALIGSSKTVGGKKQNNINWEDQTVCCYISGIEGKQVLSSKKIQYSDVNILAVINPDTHKILLVNTPRDCLFNVPDRDNVVEKIDAMNLHGKNAARKTLENLYDVKIDCTVTVSYKALKQIVNAVGGVEVYAEEAFDSDWGYTYQEGKNFVDGDAALSFVRERHHLSEGDVERGRHQQNMIKAILEKIQANKSMDLFEQLLDIWERNIETTLSVKSLEKLIQWQLSDSEKWSIDSMGIVGTPSSAMTDSSGGEEIYVLMPDKDSIEKAIKQIRIMYDE